MKILKSRFFNIMVIIILTIVALYFNLKDVYVDVLRELSKVNIWFLSIAIFIILLYYFFEGLTITIFSRLYNKAYTVTMGFKNALIGVLFSNVTPFATGGEAGKAYILKKQGLKTSEAIGVLLMKFIIYQIALVTFGLIAVSIRFKYFFTNYRYWFWFVLLGFIINLGVISILVLAAVSVGFHNFVADYLLKFFFKIRIIKDYDKARIKFDDQVEKFRIEIINLFKNKTVLIQACVFQFLRLFIFYTIPFFALKAIDPSISYDNLLSVMTLIIFVYSILAVTPIPGDSGISETIYILLFTTIFTHTLTSSSMIIWRFVCTYFPMIIGGIYFILFNKKKKIK